MNKYTYGKRSKKSSSHKRSIVKSRATIPRSIDVYSSKLPHYFKRHLSDGVFFCSAANTVSVRNSLGGIPGWLSLGSVSADQGGVANTGQFGFSITTSLFLLNSYAEFQALFEMYCIEKVEVKITAMMGDSYNAVASQTPTLYSCLDYTDDTPPVTQLEINEYQNCQEVPLNSQTVFKRSAKPRFASENYVDALQSGYGVAKGWIATAGASASVKHYAHKFYVRNFLVSGANQGNAFRVQPTIYFKFKEEK